MAAGDDVYRDWPMPLGVAAVAPYADDHEHVIGLCATAVGALGGWLAGVGAHGGPWTVAAWERCAAQVTTLAPAGLAVTAPGASSSLHGRRLAATRVPPALAVELDRCALDAGDRVLVALALGFELSPAHARLIADVGALWAELDPGGPTLATCAAALAPGQAQPVIAAVAARVAPGARLVDGALLAIEPAAPLWRARLRVAPRLVALAAGGAGDPSLTRRARARDGG